MSCTQCDYKASDKKGLVNHNQVKHNVVMSGLCQTVGEIGKSVDFTISSNVSRQMESQEGLKHEALEGCEGISLAVHSVVEEGQSRIFLLSSHQWWLLAGASEMQQWSATKERRSAVRQKKKK